MNEVTRTEADPLVSALDDPSAAVRVAALRSLVRLPLPREGWIYISHRIMRLLQETPVGESFNAQTVDGMPYHEIIDAAAFVPTKAVRGRLHELLQDPDQDVRRAVARALTRMGDPRAVPQLVTELSDPIPDCRADAAENLSLLDVSEHRVAVQEAFRGEPDGEARFWMALALARLGETSELEQIFEELTQGTLDLPRSSWGDPLVFADKLIRRGPFPQAAQDLLLRISQERQEGPVAQIAQDLLSTGPPAETSPAPDFQPPPPPAPELQRLIDTLAGSLEDKGPVEFAKELSGEVIPEILMGPLVAHLPPDVASRLVPALFRTVMRWGVGFANGIVEGVWYLGNKFVPPLHELFECYLQLWKEAESGQTWPSSLRWQLAWTISRAGIGRVLLSLGPRLKSENDLERVVTARLIEDCALYVRQAAPPFFGGGGPPADVAPHRVELIDTEEMHEALVGAEPEAVAPEMPKHRRMRDRGVRSKSPVRKRVVSTGFSTHISPDEPVKKTMPLKVGEKYFFWLEIGKAVKESIEETPTDIPQVPAKARLTVAVFGYKDGIKVKRGADVGELEVQP
ncbi:MAG: HEAT repeat domain-containing protein, partial [Desulforhopalus sp.]|nr:HEAT repeat domain-containing protein [Desulforhopalus sp.]